MPPPHKSTQEQFLYHRLAEMKNPRAVPSGAFSKRRSHHSLCRSENTRRSGLLQQHHPPGLHERTPGEPAQAHPAGQPLALLIPAIPAHRVGAGLLSLSSPNPLPRRWYLPVPLTRSFFSEVDDFPIPQDTNRRTRSLVALQNSVEFASGLDYFQKSRYIWVVSRINLPDIASSM